MADFYPLPRCATPPFLMEENMRKIDVETVKFIEAYIAENHPKVCQYTGLDRWREAVEEAISALCEERGNVVDENELDNLVAAFYEEVTW